MPTNDFKPFATAGGANVSTQAEYLALAALSTGWQSGKASSKEVNKAVRQATFIAAALAQFVSDKGAVDVLDDGNLAGFGTNLIAALNQTSQPLDATLTALAALVGAANKLPYFNGADTAALTDLTQIGRDIIGKADVAAVLTYLGLKTAAQRDVGTAANQIPDMSAFPCLITAKGYLKLPNGMILQWGTKSLPAANASTNNTTDTFAINFPNGILASYATGTSTTSNTPCFATAEAISTTQVRLMAVAIDLAQKTITQGMAVTISWLAIGQ